MANIKHSDKVRHLVTLRDYSREDIMEIIEISMQLKEAEEKGIRIPLLKDMSLGMMFDQESTRTRVSFEAAMTHLGGHALYLSTKTMHVSEDLETVKETSKVVSSMCDAICVRSASHDTVLEMAKYSTVPVINALSGVADGSEHPTQVIADVITMIEHLPKGKELKDVVFMYIGDTTSKINEWSPCIEPVFRSHCHILSKLGITVVACSPKHHTLDDEFVNWINDEMRKSGGKLIMTEDPMEYIGQADFLYTGTNVYHGIAYDLEQAIAEFYPKYQINAELMSHAQPHCGVMHYLPGHRNLEITDEVWDGPQSLLMPQAENRLTAEKGILTWLLYPLKRYASQQLVDYYTGRIESTLTKCEHNYL